MTRNTRNNRNANTNANETRHNVANNELKLDVKMTGTIQPKPETATSKAADKASKEAAREARKAAREAARLDRKAWLENAMSLNACLKACADNPDAVLPSGITAGEYLSAKGIEGKLTVSSFRKALNKELVQADGIHMWEWVNAHTSVWDESEGESRDRKVKYFDTKKKTWKRCGHYELKLVKAWTPRLVLEALELSLDYANRTKSMASKDAKCKEQKLYGYVSESTRKGSRTGEVANDKIIAVNKADVVF